MFTHNGRPKKNVQSIQPDDQHPQTTENTDYKPTQSNMEEILSAIVYVLLELVMKGIIEGTKILFAWVGNR